MSTLCTILGAIACLLSALIVRLGSPLTGLLGYGAGLLLIFRSWEKAS